VGKSTAGTASAIRPATSPGRTRLGSKSFWCMSDADLCHRRDGSDFREQLDPAVGRGRRRHWWAMLARSVTTTVQAWPRASRRRQQLLARRQARVAATVTARPSTSPARTAARTARRRWLGTLWRQIRIATSDAGSRPRAYSTRRQLHRTAIGCATPGWGPCCGSKTHGRDESRESLVVIRWRSEPPIGATRAHCLHIGRSNSPWRGDARGSATGASRTKIRVQECLKGHFDFAHRRRFRPQGVVMYHQRPRWHRFLARLCGQYFSVCDALSPSPQDQDGVPRTGQDVFAAVSVGRRRAGGDGLEARTSHGQRRRQCHAGAACQATPDIALGRTLNVLLRSRGDYPRRPTPAADR